MTLKTCCCFLLYVCWAPSMLAQFTWSGQLIDTTQASAPAARLFLFQEDNKQYPVDSTTCDAYGYFTLKATDPGSYVIEVTGLFYDPLIVKVQTDNAPQDLRLFLKKKDLFLQEVVVEGEQEAIMEKGDTIIYHVPKLQRQSDENLEAMIKRLPGFSVDASGEIAFRGKPIDRILLDGEEITDVGHAILSRSITPDMLQRMTVRTKDKNERLKRNLLDNSSYLVLDLSLDEALNRSFFGEAKAGGGSQAGELFPYGYASVFSLQDQLKIHTINEVAYFGNPALTIYDLKELDLEAYHSIFSLPASFEGLKEKETFQSDIYGFKDYFNMRTALSGTTLKWSSPDEKLTIEGGSYSNGIRQDRRQDLQQLVFQDEQRQIETQFSDTDRQFFIKNKVGCRYKMSKTAWLQYNLHFNYSDFSHTSSISRSNLADTDFSRRSFRSEWISRIQFEKTWSSNWALQLNGFYTAQENTGRNSLMYRDSAWQPLFDMLPATPNSPASLRQNRNIAARLFSGKAYLLYSKGNHEFGFENTVTNDYQTILNTAANRLVDGSANEQPLARFSGQGDTRVWSGHSSLNHTLYGNGIVLQSSWGLQWFRTVDPATWSGRAVRPMAEVYAKIYVGAEDDLSLQWKMRNSPYRLDLINAGLQLSDIQSIEAPQTSFWIPPMEHVVEVSYSLKGLKKKGIFIQAAGLFGATANNFNSTVAVSDQTAITLSQPDTLQARYALTYLSIEKRGKKRPWKMKYEGSALYRVQNNRSVVGTEVFQTFNRFFSNQISLETNFSKSPLNYSLNGNYRIFIFRNPSSGFRSRQQTFSYAAKTHLALFRRRVSLEVAWSGMLFFDENQSNYHNLQFDIHWKATPSTALSLHLFNAFDNRFQFQQYLNPFEFGSIRITGMPRYLLLKVGHRFL